MVQLTLYTLPLAMHRPGPGRISFGIVWIWCKWWTWPCGAAKRKSAFRYDGSRSLHDRRKFIFHLCIGSMWQPRGHCKLVANPPQHGMTTHDEGQEWQLCQHKLNSQARCTDRDRTSHTNKKVLGRAIYTAISWGSGLYNKTNQYYNISYIS